MVFKSRIKWIALLVLILSMGSLVVHLSMTKSSGVQLAYSARDNLWQDFDSLLGAQDFRNKHLWRPVKSLETLQPYANPRNSYPDFQIQMALVRGIFVSKKILDRSIASKRPLVSAPKGFIAVYVGESLKKQRYNVSVSYLNQPLFQTLLSKSEDEFRFDHPMGGLTIPCPEDTFLTVTSRIQG